MSVQVPLSDSVSIRYILTRSLVTLDRPQLLLYALSLDEMSACNSTPGWRHRELMLPKELNSRIALGMRVPQ